MTILAFSIEFDMPIKHVELWSRQKRQKKKKLRPRRQTRLGMYETRGLSFESARIDDCHRCVDKLGESCAEYGLNPHPKK